MSKELLRLKNRHQPEFLRVGDDDLWRFNVLLRPRAVKRRMGNPLILIIGRRYFKLKRIRALKGAGDGPRKPYRIVCKLLHTDEAL